VWSRIRRRQGGTESPIVRRPGERSLRTALEAVGLFPLTTAHYGFNLFLPPLDSRLPALAMRAQTGLERVARGHLRHLATDYAVVARQTSGGDLSDPADTGSSD
jgi:hypothetical protein